MNDGPTTDVATASGERTAVCGVGVRRWAVDQPVCALCAGPGTGGVVLHHLTHGVSVLLCEAHRSVGYLCREGGQDFAAELAGLWSSSGCLSGRHRSAIAAHLRQVGARGADRRSRPGSYSWPVLRGEAERRFAAGEPPRRVIYELRAHHAAGDAIVPSVRTMRRWFCEARWLSAERPGAAPSAPPPPPTVGNAWSRRIMPLSEIPSYVRSLTEPYGWWALSGRPHGSARRRN